MSVSVIMLGVSLFDDLRKPKGTVIGSQKTGKSRWRGVAHVVRAASPTEGGIKVQANHALIVIRTPLCWSC